METSPPPPGQAPRELPPLRDWGGARVFREAPALKWIIAGACGCGGLILLIIFGTVAVILALGFGAIKQSDVYQQAVTRAKSNPEVLAALGQPISEGWMLSGSVEVHGSSGSADISVPISGPKGKGRIYAAATKSAGEWTYSKLVVKVDSTDETIDLAPP